MVAIAPVPLRLVTPEWSDRVPAQANDSMTVEERDRVLADNPDSFLHITRSAGALLPGQAATGWTIHQGARIALHRLLELGAFDEVREPGLYAVRLRFEGHEQLGVLGGIALAHESGNDIRAHENVHAERVDDLAEHLGFVSAESSPVALAHQPNEVVAAALRDVVASSDPISTIVMSDTFEQSLWPIDDPAVGRRLVEALTPEIAYIIDGHHRVAAAREIGRRGVRAREALGLTALFPLDELDNRPYHRVLMPPVHADELFDALIEQFPSTDIGTDEISAAGPDELTFYAEGRWLRVGLPPAAGSTNPLDGLDATRLQRYVLGPLCGIDEADPVGHLEFVPGNRPRSDIARDVDERGGVLCLSRPVSMSDLVAVADAGLIMPPKSTFFVPKLRAGIVLHELHGIDGHIPAGVRDA